MASAPRPLIFGCAGPVLTKEERRFFAEARPCGLILFRRNCETIPQLSALVASFRETIDDPLAPVFVDQEGGRVLRLKPPVWWPAPAAGRIGRLAERDRTAGVTLAFDVGRAIGAQLAEVGVTVNFAPCLDVRFPFTHEAIGDRAYGGDPDLIAALGRAFADGMAVFGVQATLKHLPGHGRARLDSHRALPTIDVSRDALATDLAPFAALRDLPWGIVSHLLYPALDPSAPATLSPTIIRTVIRETIGFDGLLVSDDIVMKALAGPPAESAVKALAAGCDIVCHCSANVREMTEIARRVAPMDEALAARMKPVRAPAVAPPRGFIADLGADIDRRLA
jgi:beta-N-acetylhexosaminidase